MIDRTIVVGPFQCNCRLIACDRTGQAALIDPGDQAERILKALKEASTPSGAPLRVRYLLHTHAHLDHIGATREVHESLAAAFGGEGPEIALHRADEPLYKMLREQGRLFGFTHYGDPLPVDRYLEDGEELKVGHLKLTLLHTPGHSPGSVCLRLHEDSSAGSRETVFSGDTLFERSVGRTDLWGGDYDALMGSIRGRLFTLDDDTRVCPGHGPDTRIGIEKRENPFLT